MQTGNVLGIRIACIEYDEVVDRVLAAARAREAMCVTALAVHGVVEGYRDRRFGGVLNQFDAVCPDGQPVRWALGWLGYARLPDRVYGPTLMHRICAQAARERLGIYLFGSSEDTLAKLQKHLARSFPLLRVCGSQPSRFRNATYEEAAEDARRINASGAQIVFCGLGCPRQEIWCWKQRDSISGPLIAVGAAFAFHAAVLPQAPGWMQRLGMEWFFRLVQEPRRLWWRYLLFNPYYLLCVFLQKSGARKFRLLTRVPQYHTLGIPG